MRKLFYAKLAANNLRKNAKSYMPYLLTCIATVSMFYIMVALSMEQRLFNMPGGDTVQFCLYLGRYVIGIFAVIFLFYTHSFLLKSRKKEFGLLNILGMEKKHLAKMMLLETVYTAVISIVLGLLFGLLLYKLIHLGLLKLIGMSAVPDFYVSLPAMRITLLLFGAIFVLTLVHALWQVQLARPVELLKGGQTGEREPKTKALLAMLGVLCLGGGYWISVTTYDPLLAFIWFFVAVVLVILGTYCLFTAGSIALLKRLRKNKRYYYQTNHFISVSGMMYRMKQNAVGLANICVLSTMVLVMVSATTALYIGVDDALNTRYPHTISVAHTADTDEASRAEIDERVASALSSQGVTAKRFTQYAYVLVNAMREEDTFTTSIADFVASASIYNLCFLSAEDFGGMIGFNIALASNEVLIYGNRGSYGYDAFTLNGIPYVVSTQAGDYPLLNMNGGYNADVIPTYYIVMENLDTFAERCAQRTATFGGEEARAQYTTQYYVGIDMDAPDEQCIAVSAALTQALADQPRVSVEARADKKQAFYSLYGGLFFLGLFLAILFILATVLILYYKQITEGHEDKERFIIMKNIGLSRRQIKRTVHSQMLILFFLPLATAFVHIAFAFPMITRMLAMLNLTNVSLFALCTIGAAAVFAAFYAFVYGLTTKVYDRIVGDARA